MDPAYGAEIEAFRQRRHAALTSPTGWLSLVARYPLGEGDNELPIGTFLREGDRVTFRARAGVEVTCDGHPVLERVIRSDEPGPPDRLRSGDVSYELVQRGGVFAVRVRDPRSPALRSFPGLTFYPVRPEWRVVARFDRHDPPRTTRHAFEEGEGGEVVCPGVLVFEVQGRQLRLEPTIEADSGRMLVIFGDETNRDETYPAGRFLYAPIPAPDAPTVVLDFNKAYNPPCAFTPFASCPLVPAAHRLPLRIEAGEKGFRAGPAPR